MIVEIAPATERDAEEIMRNLREEDSRGVELLGIDGLRTLKTEIIRANCAFTGKVDGEVAVIWGITSASLLSDEGFVWMVTSRAADRVPFIFARRSQRELEQILTRIPRLHGICFAFNKRSLRWIRWLGASIGNLTYNKGIASYPFEFRRG